MSPDESPLYVSNRLPRNLWQEYRVFKDRLELESHILLHTFIIPLNDIQGVSISPPLLYAMFFKQTWKGGIPFRLDMAPLFTHVAVLRKKGIFRNIRFIPDNPDAFMNACNHLLDNVSK